VELIKIVYNQVKKERRNKIIMNKIILCGTTLTPKAGDCCIFCSYGTVKCPPLQEID